METLNTNIEYKVKKTGEVISGACEYPVYSKDDGCKNADILALANRQAKVDCQNKSRASLQAQNGHSTRPVLTPEQKAQKSKDSKVKADLFKALKSNPAEMQALMEKLNLS